MKLHPTWLVRLLDHHLKVNKVVQFRPYFRCDLNWKPPSQTRNHQTHQPSLRHQHFLQNARGPHEALSFEFLNTLKFFSRKISLEFLKCRSLFDATIEVLAPNL